MQKTAKVPLKSNESEIKYIFMRSPTYIYTLKNKNKKYNTIVYIIKIFNKSQVVKWLLGLY